MNHCGTYTIETKRLLLREFMVEDAEAMFQNWASDKEVTKFLTWPAYTSLDTAIHILNEWTASYEKPDFYQWAIVPKISTNRLVQYLLYQSMKKRRWQKSVTALADRGGTVE